MADRFLEYKSKIRGLVKRNSVILSDNIKGYNSVKKNKLNLNTWTDEERAFNNVGDYLSKIIVQYVLNSYGIDYDSEFKKTIKLCAIGSILPTLQDCAIWGSGFLKDNFSASKALFYKSAYKKFVKQDIRLVRGPKTKEIFEKLGVCCPEVYGDPALLISKFYYPQVQKKKEYGLIPHFNQWNKYYQLDNYIAVWCEGYKGFIQQVLECEYIISSSLHGLIIADAYGIPNIYLDDGTDIFKYMDYFFSVGREDYPIARTIEEAIQFPKFKMNSSDLLKKQNEILMSFPIDLFELL